MASPRPGTTNSSPKSAGSTRHRRDLHSLRPGRRVRRRRGAGALFEIVRDAVSANGALPQLLDCKGLQRELGVTRAAAEAIMRRLDTVQIEDLRKVYVRRSDVLAYLKARTFTKDQVAA